jgi:preprotein translocase subunit SecE
MSDDAYDDDDDLESPATPVESSSDESTADEKSAAPGTGAPSRRAKRKERTSPRQFLREVRSELRKVAWPARKELISYSLVVLVSVTLITLYITGLDYVFGQLILRMFSA